MRALVLSGRCGAWRVGPRSAAELREAATHYERAAALLHSALAVKAVIRRFSAATRPWIKMHADVAGVTVNVLCLTRTLKR